MDVPLRPIQLAATLGPIPQPLCGVRLLAQLLEALLHHPSLLYDDVLGAPAASSRAPVPVAEERNLQRHIHPQELRREARLARSGDSTAQPPGVGAAGVEDDIPRPPAFQGVVEGVHGPADAPLVHLLVRLLAHAHGEARVPRLVEVGFDVQVAPLHPPQLLGGLPRAGEAHEEQGVRPAAPAPGGRGLAAPLPRRGQGLRRLSASRRGGARPLAAQAPRGTGAAPCVGAPLLRSVSGAA
mmetsp:Transcript_53440/g.150105  ORF Transcript_53440/g.150105 Transcript_53440/m.150105 type:complete len:240 (-) Transcript_53440:117-836(-)